MLNRSLFSSKSDEWETPQSLFDALSVEFRFTLDVCASVDNAKCARFFTKSDDGLSQSWADEVVFMNPPYSKVAFWMRKAYESTRVGATVVCLVPSRTDTRWWHDYAMKGEIRMLRGRIRFVGAHSSAPFPSAVVILRPQGFAVCAAVVTARKESE